MMLAIYSNNSQFQPAIDFSFYDFAIDVKTPKLQYKVAYNQPPSAINNSPIPLI